MEICVCNVWLTILWPSCPAQSRRVSKGKPVLLIFAIAFCTIWTFWKIFIIVIWISRMAEFNTMMCTSPENSNQIDTSCTNNCIANLQHSLWGEIGHLYLLNSTQYGRQLVCHLLNTIYYKYLSFTGDLMITGYNTGLSVWWRGVLCCNTM
jgi:hypothetical protein